MIYMSNGKEYLQLRRPIPPEQQNLCIKNYNQCNEHNRIKNNLILKN